ncbi:MAG: response regulator [Deltaproteobacteria bacterium]|nr:response regulator [Deltaproteobacteria bacterium]
MSESQNLDRSPEPSPVSDRLHRRVLVVADEQPLRTVLDSLLAAGGHEVRSVASACDALAAFWQDPKAFDVVLVDLDPYPDGGFALAEYLLNCRPGLSVVFLGASDGDVDRRFAHAGRQHRVLRKPFEPEDLMVAVEEAGALPGRPDRPRVPAPAAEAPVRRRPNLDCAQVRRLLQQAVVTACE